MKIRIYAGLSLTKAEIAKKLPGARVAPPVRRGDVLRDIDQGFHVIGIIDGLFYQQLSVSPSEIQDALRAGVKVFGSSSIGALRAAELERSGMVGVGRIFEAIRETEGFRDDWLGQLFVRASEGDGGFAAAPPIESWMALKDLLSRGLMSRRQFDHAVRILGKTHFSDHSKRNVSKLLESERPLGPRRGDFSKALLRFPSPKKADAFKLLAEIDRHVREIKRFQLS